MAQIVVHNNTTWDISELRLAPPGTNEYSDDAIDAGDTIPPEGDYTIDYTCGTYDIKIKNTSNSECVISSKNICPSGPGFVIESSDIQHCL